MTIRRLDHVNFITHNVSATIYFYCSIFGLEHGNHLSIDTAQSVYFYIPGEKIAILHIGNAACDINQPKFKRVAELNPDNNGYFSTGAFDHFCLAFDDEAMHTWIKSTE
jgi:catechol 2,3-dioxygenase-like lactoylglutathione lyase family enzyme